MLAVPRVKAKYFGKRKNPGWKNIQVKLVSENENSCIYLNCIFLAIFFANLAASFNNLKYCNAQIWPFHYGNAARQVQIINKIFEDGKSIDRSFKKNF